MGSSKFENYISSIWIKNAQFGWWWVRQETTLPSSLMPVSPNKGRRSTYNRLRTWPREHPIKRSDVLFQERPRRDSEGGRNPRGNASRNVDGKTKRERFSRKKGSASCNSCRESFLAVMELDRRCHETRVRERRTCPRNETTRVITICALTRSIKSQSSRSRISFHLIDLR